jgi:hypothetical protein
MRSRRTGWGWGGNMQVASPRASGPGTRAPAPRRGPFGPAKGRDLPTTLRSVVDVAGDARCPPLPVSRAPGTALMRRLPSAGIPQRRNPPALMPDPV